MTRRGFTLLELMASIALVGVLAAILLPALARAREYARRASCMNNVSQIGVALHMYAAEYEGYFPWSGGAGDAYCLLALYPEYMPERRIFVCPSDSRASDSRAKDGEETLLTTALDVVSSVRVSYDYAGVYTAAPLRLPPLERGIPALPLMWDIGSGNFSAPEAARERWQFGGEFSANHVPGGGNVLWMDGSVSFRLRPMWTGWNTPAGGLEFGPLTPDEALFERHFPEQPEEDDTAPFVRGRFDEEDG